MATKTRSKISTDNNKNFEFAFEMVDAAKAREMLGSNVAFTNDKEPGRFSNRPISMVSVQRYAGIMLAGKWVQHPDAVLFDEKGKLINGQHRLLAIILASESEPDLAVPLLVSRDWDNNVFQVLDTGRPRTGAQLLQMSGHRNTLNMAAALRLIYCFRNVPKVHDWSHTRIENAEMIDLIEHNEVDPYLKDATLLRTQIGMIVSGGAAALYLCHKANDKANYDEFVSKLATGLDMSRTDDPVFVLRNALVANKGANGARRLATTTHMFMTIKAWNDWLLGVKRVSIAFRTNEMIPRPLTAEDVAVRTKSNGK